MKKWFVIGVIAILSVISLNVLYSLNSLPNFLGNQVHTIKIIDMETNVVTSWTLLENRNSEDRDKITTVLKAFTNGPLTERNYNPPRYWIQIGVKSGISIDYLVWLEDGKSASYLHGTQMDYYFGIGETAVYPIVDEARDDLLRILSEIVK